MSPTSSFIRPPSLCFHNILNCSVLWDHFQVPGYLPGYVEEGGLEEEEEDHPLVVLVVDNIALLARL